MSSSSHEMEDEGQKMLLYSLKTNTVKRGVTSACPNWLDMAPLYVFSLWGRGYNVIPT